MYIDIPGQLLVNFYIPWPQPWWFIGIITDVFILYFLNNP